MSYSYEPSLLDLNGRLIEGYRRKTRASNQVKQELDLSTSEAIYSNLGVTPVEEFLVLQATNLNDNDLASWSLERIGQAVKIESVFVDAPNADSLTFQVLSEGNIVFTFNLNRNKTPYDFPENPLSPNLQIRIKAKSNINILRIILKPVVILETYSSDEDINYASGQSSPK